jgi:simple sugar transport system ATP-binding protein
MKQAAQLLENGHPKTLVEMRNITKAFPGVVANDGVSFDIQPGEIDGLLGENGAGKTTLMKILYGMYKPDSGEILVRGKPVSIASPLEAIRLGIGMVHQHFMLVQDMTVLENVILGLKVGFNREPARKRLVELSQRYGLPVAPDSYVWQMSVGELQRVEILKALYREVQILILDEPTAVLAPQEIQPLFQALRGLKAEGMGIVLITHKLDEVMDVASRVTVLRNGKRIATVHVSEVTTNKLAMMMIGRELGFRVNKTPVEQANVVLRVESLRALDDRAVELVRKVSFEIKRGEIFGIAGVSGNGQRELTEVIVGLRPCFSGKVMLSGKNITNLPPHGILGLGVAYVPEERNRDGCIPDFTVAENLILKNRRDTALRKGTGPSLLLNLSEIDRRAKSLVTQFDIRTPSVGTAARSLSGGNLQRLILARELSGKPNLVIAAQPTRGLDIAATEYVRQQIVEMRNAGAAVLLISEDLTELLSLSDRMAVMYKGEFVGVFNPSLVTIEDVGLMMTGVKRMQVPAA